MAPVVSFAVTVTLERAGRGGRAGDQAGGGADRQARGQAGGAVGERLAGGRVGGVDLQAGRGAHGAGLAAGVGDRDRVAGRRVALERGQAVWGAPAGRAVVGVRGTGGRAQDGVGGRLQEPLLLAVTSYRLAVWV